MKVSVTPALKAATQREFRLQPGHFAGIRLLTRRSPTRVACWPGRWQTQGSSTAHSSLASFFIAVIEGPIGARHGLLVALLMRVAPSPPSEPRLVAENALITGIIDSSDVSALLATSIKHHTAGVIGAAAVCETPTDHFTRSTQPDSCSENVNGWPDDGQVIRS